MLKYRQFLEQSRALRNYRSSSVQNGPNAGPFIQQQDGIKDLVSQPNYGQIFYGDSKKQKFVTPLQQSLINQKHTKQKLATYLNQLQQENLMLKSKLSEVMSQMSPQNSNQNINSHLKIAPPNYVNHSAVPHPAYLSPSLPSQQNIAPPQYQNYNAPPQINQRPKATNVSQNSKKYQQPAQPYQAPKNNIQVSNKYRPQSLPISQQPEFQQYNQRQGQNYEQDIPQFSVNPSNTQIPGNTSPFMSQQQIINESIPIQPVYQQRRNQQPGLYTLARQKLNEIKDDDEQLRMYTIKLLKKPR